MKKFLFKLIVFLPIVCFFLFPRQIASATSYWAPFTVGVSTPGGTPIANVKLDFNTSSTATYTGGSQLRQCTSEAFVKKIASGYQYLKDLTFYTGADGKVTWNGVDDYGFACSCNDMRVVINLPEGYVVAGLYNSANNPLAYNGGTTAGGTASTFVTASNNTRSSIYWKIKPQAPPTTTTTVPACSNPCQRNEDCANRNGCPYCDTNTNRCVVTPPTTTTTVPPISCSSPCTVNPDCESRNGCPYCDTNTNRCVATPPATNPPATNPPATNPPATTPPFNPASCTCDGITYSALFSGQTVTITSFSKIVGADINNATVVSEKFHLAKGDSVSGKIIAESDNIPSKLIKSSSSIARYQTQWQFILPQLETGATYRLWSDINCQPKTSAKSNNVLLTMAVLGAEIKASFWDNVLSLFGNFANNIIDSLGSGSTVKKTIQLETFKPATVIEKKCSTIIFRQD